MGKLVNSKAARIQRVLRAVETVTTLAAEHDRAHARNNSHEFSQEEKTKLSNALAPFEDADDLLVLAKCFDGLSRSCGTDVDMAYLDVFEEAYLSCLKRLSLSRSGQAGIYLEDLSKSRNGMDKVWIRQLIKEQARRVKPDEK